MLLPAEHGSWAWLLVPFGVGTAVSRSLTLPVWLVLVGALAVFLLRQPATIWLRARQGKAGKTQGQTAVRWLIFLGIVALICLLGVLGQGRWLLLWLLLPPLLILLGYLLVAQRRPADVRSLWLELAGAAVLALLAPASYTAATNRLDTTAWLLWGLLAGQNVLGALYVRLRIADTHKRPFVRLPTLLIHWLAFGATILLWWLNFIQLPALLPYLFFALRLAWAFPQPRPVANIKRFGLLETAVELLGGLCYVLGMMN